MDSSTAVQFEGAVTFLVDHPDDTIVYKQELARVFKVSVKTVDRMVMRGELPPPALLGGKNIWLVGRIREWVNRLMAKREKEAWAIMEKME